MNVGLSEPSKFLEGFARSGSHLLEELRSAATQTLLDKSLRRFPIREAAAMLGFTRNISAVWKRKERLGCRLWGAAERRSRSAFLSSRKDQPLPRPARYSPLTLARQSGYSLRGFIFKGGSAKTTTAAHLAHRCALDGLRVLLIDLDPQASLTMLHGILPDIDIQREDTLADVLVYDPSDIQSVIRETYFPGLRLIPANLGLQDAEVKLLDHRENQEEFLDLPAFQRLDYGLKKSRTIST